MLERDKYILTNLALEVLIYHPLPPEGNLNYIMTKYKRRKITGLPNKMGSLYLQPSYVKQKSNFTI